MENFQSRNIALSQVRDEERIDFYKKTYSHVAGGVLLFIIAEFIFLNIPPLVDIMLKMTDGWKWLVVLGGFMLITNYAESAILKTRDKKTQYIAYGIYILAEALIFVPLLYIAIGMTGGSYELIQQAALVTIGLFAGLSAIVITTKKDFSFLRGAIMIGGFIAIGLVIAGSLFGFNLGLWFSVAMCALAGGSILYQTSNLVHKYGTEDYIPAALGLFASLMLLFWYILRIFMNRS